MSSFEKTLSLWLGIVTLCVIVSSGSLGAAPEDLTVTGCLTTKGKLKKLEFGEDPQKQCNNKQTVVTLPVVTDNTTEFICGAQFSGTYLTTIKDGQGNFASRSLVTMYKDGNLSVADSAELMAMFGQQQGSYRCTDMDTNNAKAITLDFSGSGSSQAIARSDWVIAVSPKGSITGEITVNLYRPLETCNPLEDPSQCDVTPLDTFTFTSVRVEPSSP